MNILHRFQFALVPVVLLAWPDWVKGLGEDLRLPAPSGMSPAACRSAALTFATVAGAVLALQLAVHRPRPGLRDGRYDVARRLAPFAGRGHTLVTPEAGLLPPLLRLAVRGRLGAQRRGDRPPRHLRGPAGPGAARAHRLPCRLLPGGAGSPRRGRLVADDPRPPRHASRHGYTLTASFGHKPFDTHYYLVRPDGPDAAGILEAVRGADAWYGNGRRSLNYALWGSRP
jgi:hypothetical protein